MHRVLPLLLLAMGAPGAASAQDMIFTTGLPSHASFVGKPIWVGAARCAALEPIYAEQEVAYRRQVLAEARRRWPASAAEYQNNAEWEQRVQSRVEPGQAYWRRWALARLKRDRPGENAEALYDQQLVEETATLRASPFAANNGGASAHHAAASERRDLRRACMDFLNWTGGTLGRVERGVADPILRAAAAGEGQ